MQSGLSAGLYMYGNTTHQLNFVYLCKEYLIISKQQRSSSDWNVLTYSFKSQFMRLRNQVNLHLVWGMFYNQCLVILHLLPERIPLVRPWFTQQRHNDIMTFSMSSFICLCPRYIASVNQGLLLKNGLQLIQTSPHVDDRMLSDCRHFYLCILILCEKREPNKLASLRPF